MSGTVRYSVEDSYNADETILEAARKHYKDGKYSDAIKLYLSLLKTSANSELYFDIGLCYYKKDSFFLFLYTYYNNFN